MLVSATEGCVTAEIARLAAEGYGDDAIARKLDKTRHFVRKVLVEDALIRANGSADTKEFVRLIGIEQILVLEGRRAAQPDKVAALAQAIDNVGQINPITVRENKNGAGFVLVAGLHRVEAIRQLGRVRISAVVMPASTTEAEARMIEITENLHRVELTVQEKADLVAEWVRLCEAGKSAQVGQVSKGGRGNEGGVAAAARELDMPRSTVQRDIKIASISPAAKEAARGAGIDDNQSKLLKVAAEPPEHQVETVHNLAGARAIMASRVEPDDSLDLFCTPPWATRALMERVFPHLGIVPAGLFWEPAGGEGHMSGVLVEYGQVYATDIHNYGPHLDAVCDFLDPAVTAPEADWIITNPPFGNKTVPFILRALDLAKSGIAMFVRLQCLEGIERYKSIFSVRPPTLVCPFVERVPLCKGRWKPDGNTATAYCWLVWVKDREATASQMFWIPPGCRELLTKSGDQTRYAAWSIPERDAKTGEIFEPVSPPASTVAAPKSKGGKRVADIIEHYIADHLAGAENIERLLRKFIIPKLGEKPLKQADREDGHTAVLYRGPGRRGKYRNSIGKDKREAIDAWRDFLNWAQANGFATGKAASKLSRHTAGHLGVELGGVDHGAAADAFAVDAPCADCAPMQLGEMQSQPEVPSAPSPTGVY